MARVSAELPENPAMSQALSFLLPGLQLLFNRSRASEPGGLSPPLAAAGSLSSIPKPFLIDMPSK